jgi:hypothetical protein
VRTKNQSLEVRVQNSWAPCFLALPALLLIGTAFGESKKLVALRADRTAVERIYYEHRLGTKPPFEQTLPSAQIEKMVKLDSKKEAVLARVYKVDIKERDVAAEVQRINSTTRAPEVLNEIKAALGNDPKRFGETVARPIIVERELRQRFQNDDKIHALQRQQGEQIRKKILVAEETTKRIDLLKSQKASNPNEVTWQMTQRPRSEEMTASAQPAAPVKTSLQSASYSIEATAQIAQPLAAPERSKEKFYFQDLDPELQKVLRVQLEKPGDVSAVIETPSAFLLFVAEEKTTDTLTAASLSIPKRSYDDWLASQPD